MMLAVMTVALVDGWCMAIGAGSRWEPFGQAAGTGCMTSDGVVRMGSIVVGEGGLSVECKEKDEVQADKHQLERGLERDHDGVERRRKQAERNFLRGRS